jgi:molecular chaperone GrpE
MTDHPAPANDQADASADSPETAAGVDPAPADAAPGLEQLKAELEQWRDKALRAAAETENVRRRAEREGNDARAYAIQRFARDLFDAADNLERALVAAPRESADSGVKNFVLGIEMTEKALQSAFERNGLKKIAPARGAKFDPHLHQAMMEQEDLEVEPGSVTQTMQAGYELFGRVIRPASVAVSAKRAQGDAPANPYGQANGAAAGGSVDTKA